MAGDGKRAHKKYGCPNYRYRGTCKNGIMVRVDRLEEQLLSYLEDNIFTPEMCTLAVDRFVLAVNKRLADIEQNNESYSSVLIALHAERDKHRADAERIVDAIVEAGHSTALITRLTASELKMTELQRRIDSLKPPDIKVTVAEIRDYHDKFRVYFKSLVRQAYGLTRAKRELAKHISKLVLTPRQTDGAWAYEVSGDWRLLSDDKFVIWCGGQRRDRTADAGLFRAAWQVN